MLSSDRLLKAVIYTLALGSLLGMAAIVCTRPAKADATIVQSEGCGRLSRGPCSLSVTRVVVPPNVRAVPQPTPGSPAEAEREARVQAWEARCVTGYRFDDEGVRHYVYKDKACSHGN